MARIETEQETLSESFLSPFEKGAALKGNNFPFRVVSFYPGPAEPGYALSVCSINLDQVIRLAES